MRCLGALEALGPLDGVAKEQAARVHAELLARLVATAPKGAAPAAFFDQVGDEFFFLNREYGSTNVN